MCGFAVLLKLGENVGNSSDVMSHMIHVIHHRGPDDEGFYESDAVSMGFRRLSILDISPLGHQPMTSVDGQVTLVFNGEIYNYVELRTELEARGHRFKSTGDTEVLLRSYEEWGTDCVKHFNGMWAFVIHDRRKRTLFGSRDRFGIKPLYRYISKDCILIASEIKSIRASGLYTGTTNWRVAARYLSEARLDDTTETFYVGIEQVAPATAFEISLDGKIREWSYFSIDTERVYCGNDPAGDFAELFEDSVRLHMRSDVPVGVHLSGGLDSTSILCASARLRAAEQATEPLMAFSYVAQEFDESSFIRDTIKQTNATLITLASNPVHLWSTLAEVLKYQDEPIYSMMPLVSYELMRLTRANGIKVIVNGQGADETIAGYPSYFGDYWSSLLSEGQIRKAVGEIRDFAKVHGGNRLPLLLNTIRHLTQSHLGRLKIYQRCARLYDRLKHGKHRWFTRQLMDNLTRDDSAIRAGLNASLIRSVYSTPLPRILRVEDRNAMAHSIESRLPFLDYRLVEFMFSLPLNWHMRGPWNKFVLRAAMRGRIPETVRTRTDKMGFPVPANKWLAGVLHEPVLDMLLSRAARERGVYKIENVISDVERHRRGEANFAALMFDVAQFETWCGL